MQNGWRPLPAPGRQNLRPRSWSPAEGPPPWWNRPRRARTWEFQIHAPEGGGDQLGQEIASKIIPDLLLIQPALFNGQPCGPGLELAFRLLPGPFPQHGIHLDPVKIFPRGPSPSFFPTTEAAERIRGGSSNNRLAFPLLLVPIFPSPFHFDSLSSSIPGFHGKYVPEELNRILADV